MMPRITLSYIFHHFFISNKISSDWLNDLVKVSQKKKCILISEYQGQGLGAVHFNYARVQVWS